MSEELGAILAALPHWPAGRRAAPGARVRCAPFRSADLQLQRRAPGQHFLAPVQRRYATRCTTCTSSAAWRALALLAEHEAATGAAYARVVRSRLDLRWLAAHPPLSLLPATSVWIPLGEDYYGGLNDRHAVLSRAAATAYFGRWAAILDGSVLDTDRQLAARRVDDGQALNPENFLTASLAKRGLRVRRFAPVMFLGCCDAKEVCFVDARHEGACRGGRRPPESAAAEAAEAAAAAAEATTMSSTSAGSTATRSSAPCTGARPPAARRRAALAAGARDGPSDAHVVTGVPVAARTRWRGGSSSGGS